MRLRCGVSSASPGRSLQFLADADVDLHGLQEPLLLWLDALGNNPDQSGQTEEADFLLLNAACLPSCPSVAAVCGFGSGTFFPGTWSPEGALEAPHGISADRSSWSRSYTLKQTKISEILR